MADERDPTSTAVAESTPIVAPAAQVAAVPAPGPSAAEEEAAQLRAELLSSDQLRQRFRALGRGHRVDYRRARTDPLLERLRLNERVLGETCRACADHAAQSHRLAPAAEWLLDNHYLIVEQIRIAYDLLPHSYDRELPKLASGPLAGFCRTYALAYQLILHLDARLDPEGLQVAIESYQDTAPLTLGELWSIPIMLRLGLIERLARAAERVAQGHAHGALAHGWASRLLETAEHRPTELVVGLAELSRSLVDLPASFVAHLARAIQGRHHGMRLVHSWLEQRLGEHHGSIEQLVQTETQAQAADHVSVGHAVTSLRMISAFDWKTFVEGQSQVDRVLRGDPAGTYATMSFITRDAFRHAVEEVARWSRVGEPAVAERARALSQAVPAGAGADEHRRHIGWWLLGGGRAELEAAVGMRTPVAERLRRAARRHALALYLGVVAAAALAVGALAAWSLAAAHWAPIAVLFAAAVPALAATSPVILIIHRACAALLRPRALPQLDFDRGLPERCRTVVVVPCMLSDADTVDSLLARLELRWIGNRDPELALLLLSDPADAEREAMPGDAALEARARAGIERLNLRWGDAQQPRPFGMLHRGRRWSAGERQWMGEERKRGKIMDFNRALRHPWPGGIPDGFATAEADQAWLAKARYVVVADADTQLPMGSVRRLVAAMAHPLNRPQVDTARAVVDLGHAILQPRVAISLPSALRTRYARITAQDPGIDRYASAVSDLYQDLFDQGSFMGKGVYDVEVMAAVLDGRLPAGRVLSHDLLEGCYLRAGYLSDVELLEDTPGSYLADRARLHRWVRGDWQVAAWLRSHVPAQGRRERNPLGTLAQWKLFDNLRRSLVPIALIAVAAGSWWLDRPWWLLLPLACWAIGPALSAAGVAARWRRAVPLHEHLAHAIGAIRRQLAAAGVAILLALDEAALDADAILRAGWRLWISRRRLLAWLPARQAERAVRPGRVAAYRAMAPSVALAGIGLVALAVTHARALPFAAPLLLCWLVAPAIADWLSRPPRAHTPPLDAADRDWLRIRARRIWRWFDTYLTAEHHFLPPDNVQEHPVAAVAGRTSPTNVGLALLSQFAAHDFGWLSRAELLERASATLGALESLERHRGHVLNWHDTRTLRPLEPRYVSTVDSGNLSGCLVTLAAGLDELGGRPLLDAQVRHGALDCLDICAEEAPSSSAAVARLTSHLGMRAPRARDEPATALAPRAWLVWLSAVASEVPALRPVVTGDHGPAWVDACLRQLERARAGLLACLPWLALPPPPAGAAVLLEALDHEGMPTLARVAVLPEALGARLGQALADPGREVRAWAQLLADALAQGARQAHAQLEAAAGIAARARALAEADYGFLYDQGRKLFHIGYNVSSRRLDEGHYDLLASEARLASYLAIARGQVPVEHWFALSRLRAATGGEPALASWSGSLFEYLMPLLLMPDHEGTVLNLTCRSAVAHQLAHGADHGVPWGVSESGFSATDAQLNYQYRAFGVPGLGIKRGLGQDLVIAPYASCLAAMVDPHAAVANLKRLRAEGREADYGFYEAIDYTPGRLPPGASCVVVRSWMSHHQGMALLALHAQILDGAMRRRFLADPRLRAADMLLHEKIPPPEPAIPLDADDQLPVGGVGEDAPLRAFASPATAAPEVQLLSNGRYHVMLTAAGGGSSRWQDLALTRWREDWIRDCWGQFIYLREREAGAPWSACYQPCRGEVGRYEAVFTQGRAEFKRERAGIRSLLEIAVSPEDDVEVRRLTLTNATGRERTVDATSYAEVVLAPQAAELAHPAFSGLFVHTEILPHACAILATRRPRAHGEQPPWLFHLMAVEGLEVGAPSFECSRQRFIGPRRSVADPLALEQDRLSGTTGAVLDPVAALRRSLRLGADARARVHVVTGVAATRAQALALIERYREPRMVERAFEMSWPHSQAALSQLGASEAAERRFLALAGAVIFPTAATRAPAALLASNRRSWQSLWGYGISGDLPLVVVRLSDPERMELLAEAAQAHAYWRLKGLASDLVVLVEDRSVYRQPLHERARERLGAIPGLAFDRPGGVFVRRMEQIAPDDRVLIQALARVLLSDSAGSLADQARVRPRRDDLPPKLGAGRSHAHAEDDWRPGSRSLAFNNGLGGFTTDGREYVITVGGVHATPAPWANVLANERFGTLVDEGGGGHTWLENCHEFRLTTWHNDAVCRPGGEALYLRDDEDGRTWSPCPWPAGGSGRYLVRHGFGYSVWEHRRAEIESELTVFVPVDASARVARLRIVNRGARARRLSVASCCELVLGEHRHRGAGAVVTGLDAASGALVATNALAGEFASRAAACALGARERTCSGDRREFLGPNGDYAAPAALARQRLSNRTGAGLDPCFAFMAELELEAGEERVVVLVLAGGDDPAAAIATAARLSEPEAAERALAQVWEWWKRTLGVVHVETPEPALNMMVNGWLLYQVLSARMWARCGFHQSGGAYGFRDQLQDCLALVAARPELTRAHLLRAGAHQFVEGDVLHWWHPPQDRGVRTRCSDDYLWLPWATAQYVGATGDTGVLDELVPFLEGQALQGEEEAHYDQWRRAQDGGTLYEHCLRALRHGLRFGEHGLPLIGSGDWNDGMDRLGRAGRGESVWLAFFLCDCLGRFAALARARGDQAVATELSDARAALGARIDREAWDGAWYRRAWSDDGTVVGSCESAECRIDSLPQSWAALAGATDPVRARTALASACAQLVDSEAAVIRLFTPPFDTGPLDPGYIKGYPPGVRENGGQYTHGAVWLALACARSGEHDQAWNLARMLLPVTRASSRVQAARYQAEPYVLAGDILAEPPHVGRGGWTWYTGSAGWLYRLLVEELLGCRQVGGALAFTPRAPAAWGAWRLHYRHGSTFYHIEVEAPREHGEGWTLEVDGAPCPDGLLHPLDDGRDHQVRLRSRAALAAPLER